MYVTRKSYENVVFYCTFSINNSIGLDGNLISYITFFFYYCIIAVVKDSVKNPGSLIQVG